MEINANFDDRIVVHSASLEWVDSPMLGVTRRPLDRVGNEVARATTVVQYQPGSQFSQHIHTGGEEFFVIDGVFQDEQGDFPVGSYIRNPPQSSHTPGSEQGCVIFVKLWQFAPDDRLHVRLNSNFMKPVPHRHWPGVAEIPLYSDQYETVSVQHWDANANISIDFEQGAEVFVLEGSFIEGNDSVVKHSWMRLPLNSSINAHVGSQGARVWLKQQHLPYVGAQIERVNNR